ncbi:UNVERIFIED_CONTAM: hypothetical protein K2H54_069944 [Gekko kuhli]
MRSRGLVETCPLHIVHNSYLKALQTFDEDASELAIAVYHYFEEWPVKVEEYEKLQEDLKLPQKKFLKYSPSREDGSFLPSPSKETTIKLEKSWEAGGVEDKEKYSREEDQEVFTKEDWIDRALRTGDTPKPKGSKMKRLSPMETKM